MQQTAYFLASLSPHIDIRPDTGFLICRGAIIGRTGYQDYTGRELNRKDLNPDKTYQVYRPESEVFDPEAMASFEGMPLTLGHPEVLVDSKNAKQYTCGHVRNVRKGEKLPGSYDIALIADIVVTDESLIRNIRNKSLREMSCGYRFEWAKDGSLTQTKILGNHIACVYAARAGSAVRILDSKASPVTPKSPMTKLKELIGLGLKQRAVDATPDELFAEAQDAVTFVKAKDAKAKDSDDDEDDDKDESAMDSRITKLEQGFSALDTKLTKVLDAVSKDAEEDKKDDDDKDKACDGLFPEKATATDAQFLPATNTALDAVTFLRDKVAAIDTADAKQAWNTLFRAFSPAKSEVKTNVYAALATDAKPVAKDSKNEDDFYAKAAARRTTKNVEVK